MRKTDAERHGQVAAYSAAKQEHDEHVARFSKAPVPEGAWCAGGGDRSIGGHTRRSRAADRTDTSPAERQLRRMANAGD
jgi:hypothetical protein